MNTAVITKDDVVIYRKGTEEFSHEYIDEKYGGMKRYEDSVFDREFFHNKERERIKWQMTCSEVKTAEDALNYAYEKLEENGYIATHQLTGLIAKGDYNAITKYGNARFIIKMFPIDEYLKIIFADEPIDLSEDIVEEKLKEHFGV